MNLKRVQASWSVNILIGVRGILIVTISLFDNNYLIPMIELTCGIEEILESKKNYKNFILGGIEVQYQNIYEIRKLDVNLIEEDLNVTNVLTSRDAEKFVKITDILVGNKRIRITDTYRFSNKETSLMKSEPSKEKQKKIQIMKRTGTLPTGVPQHKRDTKNIVKNIVKLFNNWLSINQQLQSQRALEQLQNLLFNIKYNNKLISGIVESKSAKPFFQRFLQFHAQEMIAASKIIDKQSHLQAIKNYLCLYRRKNNSKQSSVSTKNNDKQ